ncbi:MAG: Gfo/Idh/MocA family oxidoreductase [Defluviitaleaceae bacterium]|nr:Gfo/Idh/MocA family oxidoreductase [Defluviitaleaceae bacterium]
MKKPLNTILVGAGGYGSFYIGLLMDKAIEGLNFAAVVDPYAKNALEYNRFKDVIPVYDHMDDFLASGAKADLTIVSSPLHLHYTQSAQALKSGSHVLCEKPLVPTIAELDSLEEIAASSNTTLSVGFQWCYSSAMHSVKKRILSGEFGKPLCLKAFVCTHRDWKYYHRGVGWAGKIKSKEGYTVYDSVVSNATSHYLQNMLFLLGPNMEESAVLSNVRAENYRANDIESFDTCVMQGETNGTKVFFATTHAANYRIDPVMHYSFENATILVNYLKNDYTCTIHHKDGRIEELGHFLSDGDKNKLELTAQAIRGEGPLICSARTVRPFTALVEFLFEQVPIVNFPDEYVVKDEVERHTYVKNLFLDMYDCFVYEKLPSEMGMPWAGCV